MPDMDLHASGSALAVQPVVTITDDAGAPAPVPVEAQSSFRPFTVDSYRRLLEREAEQAKKQVEKIPNQFQEGRLVDGELKFGEAESEEEKAERDPDLVEGRGIPERLGEVPLELIGKPLEEIDPHIQDKSFVVITKRFKKKYIHRFSATKSCFVLSPWNPLRRASVMLYTNQYFDYFIITTILINCVFLALPEYAFKDTAEYVFLAIYTVEAIIKITARGFIIYKYTYLRDAWNWLDFLVIISAYLTLFIEVATGSKDAFGNISGLRTFRVLRALRTVSIVPGLKTIIGALLKSLRMLTDVILLTLFCMMIFALFAIQVYIGVLRQKCVRDPVETMSDSEYLEYVKDPEWWLLSSDGEYVICGNATGSGRCPANYTCLPNLGENPNFGYTNFDHFGWAMLNSFQLITLDFWEDIYNKIIRANGPWNIVFFIIVVFFGSFYLINLMLAVVSMSYEEEAVSAGKEKEREKKKSPVLEMDTERLRQMALQKLAKRRKKDGSRPSSRHSSHRSNHSNHSNRSRTSQSTHLQVLSAVNGSTTVSSTSLQSVGNGICQLNSVSSSVNESRFEVAPRMGNHNMDTPVDKARNIESSQAKPRSPLEAEVTRIAVAGFNPSASGGSTGSGVNPAGDTGMLGTPQLLTAETENGVNPSVIATNDDMDSYTSDESDDQGIVIVKGNWSSESESEYDDDELIDRNCDCCATCCIPFMKWLRLQNLLYKIVSDFMFEIFITICIVLNVITMSIDHYGMSDGLATGLRYANYVYTAIFTLEACIKLLALTKHYFKTSWNIFDFVIVIASLIDLGLEDVKGLSVIRGFRLLRLLRVFKLAQTWSTMRVLLSIILKTLSALGNLTFILGIVIYIFAVIGMQLFSKSYITEKFAPDEVPRWNFNEFFHSLMLIFRILCGEWIEPLWDCMRANGEICMIVFLPTLVFGNFMVLNLFLALLLNSFASDKLHKNTDVRDKSKVKQGWDRLKSIFKNKRIQVQPSGEEVLKRQASIANIIDELRAHRGSAEKQSGDTVIAMTTEDAWTQPKNGGDSTETDKPGREQKTASPIKKAVMNTLSVPSLVSPTPPDTTPVKEKDPDKEVGSPVKKEDTEAEADAKKVEDCFPAICCVKCAPSMMRLDESNVGENWHMIRVQTHRVTEHKVFEYFILVVIFFSSVSLCFEDIYLDEKPMLKSTLYYLNIVYAVIFTLEMLLKWIGLGFKKYFSSFWTILDFCIVVISLLTIVAESMGADQLSSFRSLRTLRALRPLRAISRWQGMRIVVNALMYAIPSIINVLLVCLVFWLIFSIAGVQLFGGKFFKCVDSEGNKLSHTVVKNKTECIANNNFSWVNSKVNFDNVLNGYLALFQVATFEGWMEVMEDASDAAGLDKQPIRETNFHAHWFFVIFIICGSFFTLNLFIGVIIDNFNKLKKEYEGGALDMFLTAHQRDYYNTMKKIGMRKPQKTIKRPKNKLQAFFFDVSVNTKFELAIVLLIICNMISMAVEHYRQSEVYTEALDIVNVIFISIFALEAVVKIIGMRWHYFRRGWNIFDFIVVIISILGIVLDDILSSVIITPTLLRVVRVFRIGRVLRLIKAAKGIRKLLFALIISLPALLNIGMLLFLIVFIYAIFGMTQFGHVRQTGTLDDVVNFQTFGSSLVLLFRLTTSAGWNDILDPLMISGTQCNSDYWTHPNGTKLKAVRGDCGSSGIAVFFMVSFILIAFLIIINMYIAVILENFNQAHQQEEVGVIEDDFDMFYVIWEKYDPHASQFVKYEQLSDFISDLDEPLGIPKPNELAIVALDLPIYADERLHCLDILMALVRHVLGSVDESDEFKKLKSQMEEKYQEAFPTRIHHVILSTTMQRKKEDVAAKTLQRAWRRHKTMKNILLITEMALKRERRNSLMPSRQSSSASLSSPSPLPSVHRRDSLSNTKTLKASDTARKKRQTGLMLNLPTAGDIRLPSDKDV